MNILGFDTATPSTAVALLRADGWTAEARDEVAAGKRPGHSQHLLALAAALLERAELGWQQLDVVAVGVGPGGYTGLRIGLASARGIAAAAGARLVGVGTLRALAEPLRSRPAVAVLDARRGEAFVAIYQDGDELLAPAVCAPEALAGWAAEGGPEALAIGDGALRFSSFLVAAGIAVAPAESELHRVSAAAICRIAASGVVTDAVPDYLRLADAERAQIAKTR
jgi:tRNA threonylcarbamoyladenosine biosynthesis protein TsaB